MFSEGWDEIVTPATRLSQTLKDDSITDTKVEDEIAVVSHELDLDLSKLTILEAVPLVFPESLLSKKKPMAALQEVLPPKRSDKPELVIPNPLFDASAEIDESDEEEVCLEPVLPTLDAKHDIRVVNPIQIGKLSPFIEYTVQSDQTTNVRRRFKDFIWLYCVLQSHYIVPPLVEKQLIGRFEREFIERRRKELEVFLQACSSFEHPAMKMFLSTEDMKLVRRTYKVEYDVMPMITQSWSDCSNERLNEAKVRLQGLELRLKKAVKEKEKFVKEQISMAKNVDGMGEVFIDLLPSNTKIGAKKEKLSRIHKELAAIDASEMIDLEPFIAWIGTIKTAYYVFFLLAYSVDEKKNVPQTVELRARRDAFALILEEGVLGFEQTIEPKVEASAKGVIEEINSRRSKMLEIWRSFYT